VPNGRNKIIPSVSTILVGIFSLKKHLIFTHENWKFTPFVRVQITSWLNECVNGDPPRLYKGLWRPRQFATFNICRKLLRIYCSDAVINEFDGFDSANVKVLPLLAMVTLDCRVDDVMALKDAHV